MPLQLDSFRTVLCLGAHSDDIEIGCGGTLLKLFSQRPELEVHWIVFSGDDLPQPSAGECEMNSSNRCPKKVVLHGFRDSYFPYQGAEIKDCVLQLAKEVRPELIFTHRRADMHQDHRLIAELTWNAFRDHLILEYEIPKYDGDLSTPNCYVPLEERLRRKIDHLLRHFTSQRLKPWYTADTFRSILRLRNRMQFAQRPGRGLRVPQAGAGINRRHLTRRTVRKKSDPLPALCQGEDLLRHSSNFRRPNYRTRWTCGLSMMFWKIAVNSAS